MSHDAKGRGRTFGIGDPGYDDARRNSCFNRNLAERRPDIIVQANDAAEVAAAVRLANEKNWKVGIRSGGHSWACNHVRDGGMLLDVSRLDTVEIDAEAMVARVGPGCKGHEVNVALAQRKLFFPVGHCEGVCLGGYLLQGGFGWNSRKVGPACENVIGIDYVDANGEHRFASADENAEMFWAARGAGPGFFGVVTRFHLKLHKRPRVIGAKFAFYPIERLEALVRWAHKIGPEVPESIELMLLVSRHTPFVKDAGIILTAPVFADSLAEAYKDLAFMKSRPSGARVALPFFPATLAWLTNGVMGHYPTGANYAVDNMWTHAPVDDLMPGVLKIARELPPSPSHMLWMNWAPPPKRPDMAYSLDDNIYIALYGIWKTPEGKPAAANWAQSNMAAMAPFATGMQLADENLGRRPMPFLAKDNMARLDALRAKHDPQGRFNTYMGRV